MSPPMLHVRIKNYASLKAEIEAFQRIQRGSFSLLIQETLAELRDYSEAITHKATGALASSHRVYYDASHQRGYVSPDPNVMQSRRFGRPRSVSDYASIEHSRGGPHAYYERALNEYGDTIVRRGVAAYLGRLPKGVHQ